MKTVQPHEHLITAVQQFARSQGLAIGRGSKVVGPASATVVWRNGHHKSARAVSFCLGVDHTLPEAERTAQWARDGRALVEGLEAAGFRVDRAMYGTERDWRSFAVRY